MMALPKEWDRERLSEEVRRELKRMGVLSLRDIIDDLVRDGIKIVFKDRIPPEVSGK